MRTILSHKVTQVLASIIILLSAITLIYPPDIDILERTSEYAPILMFGMLFVSFLFLIFNQRRLMFIGMLSTAFVAFFLKMASNSDIILPQSNFLPKIKVVHINLSSVNKENPELAEIIKKLNADFVSFQEYTPDWDVLLQRELNIIFPMWHKMKRVDPFGVALFSEKNFNDKKTFYYENIPNVIMTLENPLHDIDIISAYVPLLYPLPNLNRKSHFDIITEQVQKSKNPVIIMGDFSEVYWSKELSSFRTSNALNNSRRGPNFSPERSYDHIFYSDHLECVHFEEITDSHGNQLGICGTYQMKTNFQFSADKSISGYDDGRR